MGTVVHFAGPDIRINNLLRQRCAWCGLALIDYDLDLVAVPDGHDGSPSTWPIGGLVAVDGPASWTVEHDAADPLPDKTCSLVEVAMSAGSDRG